MKRQENAMVAPATLFMGLTLLAVVGGVVYYVTREEKEDEGGDGGGASGIGGITVPPAAGQIPTQAWSSSPATDQPVALAPGLYESVVFIPQAFAGMSFDVNVRGALQVLQTRGPDLAQGGSAAIGLTIRVDGPGEVELVWPKGSTPGQDILTQYRSLKVTTGAMA